MFVFIEKSKGRVELYGCAKIMFRDEKEFIKISVGYYYNLGTSDFENEFCRICKREVKREKQGKEIKTVPIIPKPITPKQTNIKVNIAAGTYIKKGDEYFFNLDGDIMTLDEIKILGYKTPKKCLVVSKTYYSDLQ